jgi:sugar/nucleoside kinase (ribokinase family)
MKRVLGIGNALVDVLIKVENEDLLKDLNIRKGSMQLVDSEFKNMLLSKTMNLNNTRASGGSSANTINGMASLGVKTGYIGKIGNDETGEFFLSDLKNNNIETFVKRCSTETGIATVLITPDSERTFGTYLGASVELDANDIEDLMFRNYSLLHLEGYLLFNKELINKALMLAKTNNLIVSLDLASYNVVEANLDFIRDIITNYVDIVFANEEEAKAFTGKSAEAALDEIAGICDTAIVKIGKHGSLIKNNSKETRVSATPARVIDTTGAGDLYAAGFLYGFSKGLTMEKCGETGALLAGKVIEVIGAKIPSGTWSEIREMLKNQK